MKRNKKAEAKKQVRILNRGEAKLKRVSVLLTELETAAGQVLQSEFGFEPEKVEVFLEWLRTRFRENGSHTSTDTPLVATGFGLAGSEVLRVVYSFDEQQTDVWLRRLVEQAQKNRNK